MLPLSKARELTPSPPALPRPPPSRSFKVVYDEGMPHHHRPMEKGRLFIHFDVKFPEPGDLSDKDVQALAHIFPPRPSLGDIDIEQCEEVSAADIDMEAEMQRQRQRQQEEDDDDEPRRGVQCAQQ